MNARQCSSKRAIALVVTASTGCVVQLREFARSRITLSKGMSRAYPAWPGARRRRTPFLLVYSTSRKQRATPVGSSTWCREATKGGSDRGGDREHVRESWNGARRTSPHVTPEIVRARARGALRRRATCGRAATSTTRRRRRRCARPPMRRSSCCRSTAASTAARASSRVRRRPPTRARATRWRRSRAQPRPGHRVRAQHDRGAQPAGALSPRRRARALDPGRASRQHAALAPARGRPAAVHALGRRAARRAAPRRWRPAATTSSPSRAPPT